MPRCARHPAHRQHDEAFGLVRSLDDLYRQMGQAFRDSFGKLWSLITGIGKQFGQKRIHPEQCGQQQRTTITVLDIRQLTSVGRVTGWTEAS